MTRKESLKWHKGPPPHVGWWLASVGCIDNIWRWWDGTAWSHPLGDGAPLASVKLCADLYAQYETQKSIKWSDYYPENARVPRIDPRKGGAK